jgi:ATP-dependent RNA helicase DDX41
MSEHKRRRIDRSPTPEYKLDDDEYEPYIPVAKRRQEKLSKLAAHRLIGRDREDELDERETELREEARRRERERRDRTLLAEAQEVHSKKAAEGEHEC